MLLYVLLRKREKGGKLRKGHMVKVTRKNIFLVCSVFYKRLDDCKQDKWTRNAHWSQ